jgi:hypothetical protein
MTTNATPAARLAQDLAERGLGIQVIARQTLPRVATFTQRSELERFPG